MHSSNIHNVFSIFICIIFYIIFFYTYIIATVLGIVQVIIMTYIKYAHTGMSIYNNNALPKIQIGRKSNTAHRQIVTMRYSYSNT